MGGQFADVFCRGLVVPSSTFEGILGQRSRATSAYCGAPMSNLSGRHRGHPIAQILRNMDTKRHPTAVEKMHIALHA